MGKIIVASGINKWGEVVIESEEKFGSHGWTENRRKVQESKKGIFVVVNKKRVYITLPAGEWKTIEGKHFNEIKWFGETVTVEY